LKNSEKALVLYKMTPCILVQIERQFGEVYRLGLHGGLMPRYTESN